MTYRAVDNHVCEAVCHFLRRRHEVQSRGTRSFPAQEIFETYAYRADAYGVEGLWFANRAEIGLSSAFGAQPILRSPALYPSVSALLARPLICTS